MERIYIITYDLVTNQYAMNNLSGENDKTECRTSFYKKDERDKFLKEYQSLKNKGYVKNLKTFTCLPKELTSKMEEVIKAI